MASSLLNVFGCFVPSSSRVVDDGQMKSRSPPEKAKRKEKEKKAGAPLPVSHFPINSHLPRL
uniref:Uncharacterized protein n=1 Tax=Nelumbo nucifera TaxID=4432 RepID=A0A822Y7F6_NELNU|nr:TPA_asm: hypothetical protein HUJ06_031412 [Nelumbo nucifera]